MHELNQLIRASFRVTLSQLHIAITAVTSPRFHSQYRSVELLEAVVEVTRAIRIIQHLCSVCLRMPDRVPARFNCEMIVGLMMDPTTAFIIAI